MDGNLLYLIALFGVLGVALVLWAIKLITKNPATIFTRYIRYPLLLPTRWLRVTRLHAIILLSFILANTAVILVPAFFPGWREIQKRAGLAAVVNIVPLCMGGRAPIVDVLNISRHWYRLIHIFLGIVVFITAVAHCIIVISLQPKESSLTTSGWATFGLLLGTVGVNIPLIKRLSGRWFLWTHRATSVTCVAVLLWHVTKTTTQRAHILAVTCCGFWTLTTALRLYRLKFYSINAQVIDVSHAPGSNTTILEIRPEKPMDFFPGCFFYIFLPETGYIMGRMFPYNPFQSEATVAMWYSSESSPRSASTLTFIFSNDGTAGISISTVLKGDRVLLDGPFGYNLHLENMENVFLTAKGMGIAGILPIALDLADRRVYDNKIRDQIKQIRRKILKRGSSSSDHEKHLLQHLEQKSLYCDVTRKVVLFWILEHNEQMETIEPYLRLLQKLDPTNRLLIVYCGYPTIRRGHSPFEMNEHWNCLDPNSEQSFEQIVALQIRKERQRVPGNMKVIACGDGPFNAYMREGVIASMTEKRIHYAECEYQDNIQHYRRRNTALRELELRNFRTAVVRGGHMDDSDVFAARRYSAMSEGSRRYSEMSDSSKYSNRV